MSLAMPKPSKVVKSLVAATLSFSLLVPAIYAETPETAAAAQTPALNAESAKAFLDDFFHSDFVQPHYVGASVVIVKDGEVVAQEGYGYADLEKQEEIDPAATVFRVASVSKSFNAVAAMQLVEQGKLSLQDDIRKHIDGLKFANPFGKPVTIADLLAHTTGFEIHDVEANTIGGDFDWDADIVDYVKANMPAVVREPGSSYMYDNFASLLLGVIVQNVSGLHYDDYVSEYIFEPLGMSNSGFRSDEELLDRLAVGYDALGQPVDLTEIMLPVMPHGGMLSTAEDVGKFMIAFLGGGASGDERILKEETVSSMQEYRSAIHPLLPDTTYGFEAPFQLPGAGSSSKVITKAGDLPGNSSYLFLIPEQNTGVFLTYNQNGALRNLLYSQFIGTFFPQYAAPVELDDFVSSSDDLAKFSGYYSDLRIGAIVSQVDAPEEADLLITDAYLGPRALIQVDDNLFTDGLTMQFTAFKVNDKGEVLYMKEPYLNPFGYALKGVQAAGFADLDESNPYLPAIAMLQSIGFYGNDASSKFEPEKAVTRADFVKHILEISGLKNGSATEELAFTDLEGHPAAEFVQLAYEIGMVNGTGEGLFNPDRAITRQEAAVMIWRAYAQQYPVDLFNDVPLAGKTSEWARQAVQMLVALGIYGPELQVDEAGAADFQSLKSLTRQEEAAILHALLMSPTDQIVLALMQQQAEEGAESAEGQEAEVTEEVEDAEAEAGDDEAVEEAEANEEEQEVEEAA